MANDIIPKLDLSKLHTFVQGSFYDICSMHPTFSKKTELVSYADNKTGVNYNRDMTDGYNQKGMRMTTVTSVTITKHLLKTYGKFNVDRNNYSNAIQIDIFIYCYLQS